MKIWNILSKPKTQNLKPKTDDLINLLLENRDIKTKAEKAEFLNPSLESITPKNVGISLENLKKALSRIQKAIKEQEQIVVFGDYDVDGITGAAIIWETLNKLGAKIMPYIPHRIDEGYGLSEIGIENLLNQLPNTDLIITVDNGIVANKAVNFANKKGLDVIITDHHVPSVKLPNAHAIVHTTALCGAGVAYLLAQELKLHNPRLAAKRAIFKNEEDTHLELAALGTVADLVPLIGANRTIVKHGIKLLCNTKRPGLIELCKQAGIVKDVYGMYEVGYLIAPRLNASGRIDSAMNSLRLLCTNDPKRARDLAEKLELANRERQFMLKNASEHAIAKVKSQKLKVKSLLFIADTSYQQGIIGLIAGKLVEKFYRPSIVVSIGEKISKASVRSITGFNIIDFLREHVTHFTTVGGHPMAAGFSFETKKLAEVQKLLEEAADKIISEETLLRTLRIDCELMFPCINTSLHNEIQKLAPFGMKNPEPVFASRSVMVKDFKILGKDRNHLRLTLSHDSSDPIEAIAFGMGEYAATLKPGDKIDVAYTIDENTWNGNTKLQLKIRDIKA